MIIELFCNIFFALAHFLINLFPKFPSFNGLNASMSPLLYVVKFVNMFISVSLLSRCVIIVLILSLIHISRPGETECAIHFHMLANADRLNLSDSGRQTENGQAIFNLLGWKYGFSTVIELDGRPAIIKYVTKYITKGNAKIFGKFYLSGGKTLKREVPAEFMNIDYASFEGQEYTIPGTGMRVKYKTFNLDWDEGELPHEPS